MRLYKAQRKIKSIVNNIHMKSKLGKSLNKYVIDLASFGITEGLPTKGIELIDNEAVRCYSDEAYTLAYNNTKGLQEAVDYAVAQGYNYIVLPKGKYAMCYNSDNYPKFTEYVGVVIDLGNSTIKVIFDSEKINPYITDATTAYRSGGTLIKVSNCKNTFLCNGTIIGDKIDRSFKVQDEKAVEWTYGVACGGGCINCGVYNMDLSLFMGDGLTCSMGTHRAVSVGYNMGFAQSALNDDGTISDSTQYCTSGYLDVTNCEAVFLQGYGYTQGLTYLTNKNYTTAFYDSDKNYMGKDTESYVLRSTVLPEGCCYVRLQVEETSVDKDGWYMHFLGGYYGQGISFRNNFIHHNHRGGLTIGVNDMYIRDNVFYRNGMYPDTDHNLPGFEQSSGVPFMTRYHINMEDSQGWNINIEDNIFIDGNIGIAARGMDYKIRRNKFKNNGITLYKLRKADISDNTGGGFNTFAYNANEIALRDWTIHNNEFTAFSVSGNSPITEFSGNIVHSTFSTDAVINNPFNDLTFYVKHTAYQAVVTLKNSICNSCKFIKENNTYSNTISLINMTLNDCEFNNIKVGANGSTFNDCIITNCSFRGISDGVTFNNCTITINKDDLNNPYPINPYNAALIDMSGYSTTEAQGSITFNNCNILFNNEHPLIGGSGVERYPVIVNIVNGTTITRTVNNNLGFNYCSPNATWNFSDSVIAVPSSVTIRKPANATITNMTLENVTFEGTIS